MPLCPSNNSGCLNCSSNVCIQCDTSNNFIVDSSNTALCKCNVGYYYDGSICN